MNSNSSEKKNPFESDSSNSQQQVIFINNICKLNENDEVAYCSDCFRTQGKLIPLVIKRNQNNDIESYECIACKTKISI